MIARQIDRTNGLLKNPFCPAEVVYTEYFVPGTEPVRECDLHSPFDLPTDSAAAANGGIIATSPGAPGSPGTSGTMRVTPGGVPIPQASRTPVARPGAPHDTVNIFKLP